MQRSVPMAEGSKTTASFLASSDDTNWLLLLIDSSRVTTYIISIFLIVYGSFRSLKFDLDTAASLKAKEKENGASATADLKNRPYFHLLDGKQALLFPLIASCSLLTMFLFFDSLQTIFALLTAVIATCAFAFVLLPVCQYASRPCFDENRFSIGAFGRFTVAEILSFALSLTLVFCWVLTGHWLLMDVLAMGLCISFIALVRLPSLKVSTVLLLGLLIYDVFWVFFSSYFFQSNVMMKVAMRPAENPVKFVIKNLPLQNIMNEPPKLSLPGKLIFPSWRKTGHFSILGLGDIVMPGLLLCFVLRYDAYKRLQCAELGLPPPPMLTALQRMTYFHCSLIGYFLGLMTATVSAEIYKNAQPALLYLVPSTLLPLLVMAYLKGDLRRMWSEPFLSATVLQSHRNTQTV